MEKQKQIDDFMDGDEFQENIVGEWAKVDANLKNEGCRLGMEEGYEQCLQKGFNAAFNEALKMSFAAGKLQGNLSAHMSILPKLSNCPVLTSQNLTTETASSSTPITNLISSCSDLIIKIPTLLKSEVAHSFLQASGKKDSLEKGSSASASCLSKSVFDNKGGEEAVRNEAKNTASCQDVCNNSEHFWSQLESFRLQTSEIIQPNH